MCIDDMASVNGLRVFAEEAGRKALSERYGVPKGLVDCYAELFGISGICNILGAIKTAKILWLW